MGKNLPKSQFPSSSLSSVKLGKKSSLKVSSHEVLLIIPAKKAQSLAHGCQWQNHGCRKSAKQEVRATRERRSRQGACPGKDLSRKRVKLGGIRRKLKNQDFNLAGDSEFHHPMGGKNKSGQLLKSWSRQGFFLYLLKSE